MQDIPDPFKNPIYITKPISPEVDTFAGKYNEIRETCILSNFGQNHNKLEKILKEYLKVNNLILFNNGTTALFTALKALNLSGEVITTPFTFPATVNAIVLAGLKPVFCDIANDYNIDVKKLDSLITEKTSAILAVHTFGTPCNYIEINKIAKKYNLKIIYDAAHAFGVSVDGSPVGELGDISMFSFHATKIFNTIEGGCLCCKNSDLAKKIKQYRNFGYSDDKNEIIVPGLNGKLNEIQSAIGLLNLPLVEEEINKRKILTNIYIEELSQTKEISVLQPKENVKHNYQYLIIEFDEKISRDYVYEKLKEYNIITRKYFYPCVSNSKFLEKCNTLPVAEKISQKTLALPLYGDLSVENVKKICKIIKYIVKNSYMY